jgi:hypothetical protein
MRIVKPPAAKADQSSTKTGVPSAKSPREPSRLGFLFDEVSTPDDFDIIGRKQIEPLFE